MKNISQFGNLPQIGMKIKNIWNHHLDGYMCNALLAKNTHKPPPANMFGLTSQAGDTIIRGPKLGDDGGKTREPQKTRKILQSND